MHNIYIYIFRFVLKSLIVVVWIPEGYEIRTMNGLISWWHHFKRYHELQVFDMLLYVAHSFRWSQSMFVLWVLIFFTYQHNIDLAIFYKQ